MHSTDEGDIPVSEPIPCLILIHKPHEQSRRKFDTTVHSGVDQMHWIPFQIYHSPLLLSFQIW
jgi:hypothetical protein